MDANGAEVVPNTEGVDNEVDVKRLEGEETPKGEEVNAGDEVAKPGVFGPNKLEVGVENKLEDDWPKVGEGPERFDCVVDEPKFIPED